VNPEPGPSPVPSGDDGPTTVYLAITLSPHIAPGDLAAIQLTLAYAARRVTATGHPVQFLHGMYLPAHTSLLCEFNAQDERWAHIAARLTRLPYVPVDGTAASRLTDPPGD
jgi:hypothetical protein